MPTEAIELLKQGILQAMQAEREGQYFYLMAAGSTEDPKGQEVFRNLAAEEQDHFNYLKKQYDSVVETGAADSGLSLGAPPSLDGSSPIFSDSIKSRIGEAHFEMTALSLAMQLELDAEKFYKDQAGKVEDQTAKSFYLKLAEWEVGHYRALLAQSETLKEDYWSKGGFSPF